MWKKILSTIVLIVLLNSNLYPVVYAQYTKTEEIGNGCDYVRIISLSDEAREKLLNYVIHDVDLLKDPTKKDAEIPLTEQQKESINTTMLINTAPGGMTKQIDMEEVLTKPIPKNHSLLKGEFVDGFASFLVELKGSLLICNSNGVCTRGKGATNDSNSGHQYVLPKETYSSIENYGDEYSGDKYSGIEGSLNDVSKVFVAGWSRVKFAQMLTGGSLAFWTDVIYGALQVLDLAALGIKGVGKIAKHFGEIKELDSTAKSIIKDIVKKEPAEARIDIQEIKKIVSEAKESNKIAGEKLDGLKKALEEVYTKDGTKIADLEVVYIDGSLNERSISQKILEKLKGVDKDRIKEILDNIKKEVEEINKKLDANDMSVSEVRSRLEEVIPKIGELENPEIRKEIIDDAINRLSYETKKIGDLISDTKDTIMSLEDKKEIIAKLDALNKKLRMEVFEKEVEGLAKKIPEETGWKEDFLTENEVILKKITKEQLQKIGIEIKKENLYELFEGQSEDAFLEDLPDYLKDNNPWAKLSEAYEISGVSEAFNVWRTTLGRERDPFFNSELLTHAINEKVSSKWAKILVTLLNPDINKKIVIGSRLALVFGSWGMILGNTLTNPTTMEATGMVFRLEKTGKNDDEKTIIVMSKDYASVEFIPTEDFIETFMKGFFETDAFTRTLSTIGGLLGISYKQPEELYNTFYRKLQNMGKYLVLHDDVTPTFTTRNLIEVHGSFNKMTINDGDTIYHISNNPVNRIVFENPLNYIKENDQFISSILLYTSGIDAGMISNISYGTTAGERFATFTGLMLDAAKIFMFGGWVFGTISKGLGKLDLTSPIVSIPLKIATGVAIVKYIFPSVSNSFTYWLYREDTQPAPECSEVLKNTQICIPGKCIDKYTFLNLISIVFWGAGWATGGVGIVISILGELTLQEWKTKLVKETWEQLNTCYESKYYIYGINEMSSGEKEGLSSVLKETGMSGLFATKKEENIGTQLEEQFKNFLGKIVGYQGAFKYQPAHLRLVTHQKDFSRYVFDRIYTVYFSQNSKIINTGEEPIEAKINSESLIFKNDTITVKNQTTGKEEIIFGGPQAFFKTTNLESGYFAIGNKIIEIDMNKNQDLMRFTNENNEIDGCVQEAMKKLGVLSPELKLEFLSTDDFDIISLGNEYKVVFHNEVPELNIKENGSVNTSAKDEIIIKRDKTVELKIIGVRTFTSELKEGSKLWFDNGFAMIKGDKMYLFIPEIYTTNINEFTNVKMNNTENETGIHIGLTTGDSKVDVWTKHIDAVYKGEKNCTERIDYKNNKMIISCSDGTEDVYDITGIQNSCVLLEKENQKYVYTFQMVGNQIYNFIAPGESCADATPEKAVFGPYPISYLWTPNGMVVFNPDTGKVELRNEFAFPLNPNFNYYGGLLQGNSFIPAPNPLGYTPGVDKTSSGKTSGPLIIPSIPEGMYGTMYLLLITTTVVLGYILINRKYRNAHHKKK